MIPEEFLKGKAREAGVSAHTIEREYIEYLFISRLYPAAGNLLAFKGGTCLRMFLNLNRFSEDLDFTSLTGDDKKIIDIFEKAAKDLGFLDIEARITGLKFYKNSIKCSLKYGKPLYREIEIEVSKRERLGQNDLENRVLPSAYPDVENSVITTLNDKNLLAEKFRAAVSRKNAKARDFYDIWHLIFNKRVPVDFSLVDRKVRDVQGKGFDLKEFSKNMEAVKSGWKIDLFRLLPASSKIEYSLIEKDLRRMIIG